MGDKAEVRGWNTGFGVVVKIGMVRPRKLESTEGGRCVNVLKRQEDAPVLLG